MGKREWLVLLAMSLAVFMFCIEYTGIVVIIPPMSQALKLTVSEIQWSFIGYLLSFAVFIIVSGRLGDIYGNRLILLIGLVVFAMASLLGGFSISAWQIILARILQGFGAALMWPNTTAIAFHAAPSRQKAFAIGVVTGVVGFSMAVGPLLAGYLSAIWSWRGFFLINIPLGILVILATYFFATDPKKRSDEGFDNLNLLLFIIALGALMLGVSLVKGLESFISWPLILILLGGFFLRIFFFAENKSANPLLKADLIKNHYFMIGCFVRATTNGGFYVFMFVMGLYLHLVLGYSPLKTGLAFLPMTLMIGIFSPIAGKIINRYGEIFTSSAGIILFVITYGLFALQFHSFYHSTSLLFTLFVLPGIAYGLSSPGLLTLTMQLVEKNNAGSASGFFYMSSVLGASFGVAITSIILHLYQSILANAFLTVMMFCITISVLGLIALLVVFKRKNIDKVVVL